MTSDTLVTELKANDKLADPYWNGSYENKWCSGACFILAVAFKRAHNGKGHLVYMYSASYGILHVVYTYRGWYYDGDGIYHGASALMDHWSPMWADRFGPMVLTRGLYNNALRAIWFSRSTVQKTAELLKTII